MAVLKRPSAKNLTKIKTKKSPVTDITEDNSLPENSGEHQGTPTNCNLDNTIVSQSEQKINNFHFNLFDGELNLPMGDLTTNINRALSKL